jgi:hypothetical protein
MADMLQPDAYKKEYNTQLLGQIVSPLKKREEESIQQQKEAFAAGGGYGSGALLSSIGKTQEATTGQIEKAATGVGLESARAKHQETMTKDAWQFRSKESEKLRNFNKLLTEMGYTQQEKMAQLSHMYQKDLMQYQSELTASQDDNLLESLLGKAVGAGTSFALGKIPGID